jgi:hypothetical protein
MPLSDYPNCRQSASMPAADEGYTIELPPTKHSGGAIETSSGHLNAVRRMTMWPRESSRADPANAGEDPASSCSGTRGLSSYSVPKQYSPAGMSASCQSVQK